MKELLNSSVIGYGLIYLKLKTFTNILIYNTLRNKKKLLRNHC